MYKFRKWKRKNSVLIVLFGVLLGDDSHFAQKIINEFVILLKSKYINQVYLLHTYIQNISTIILYSKQQLID